MVSSKTSVETKNFGLKSFMATVLKDIWPEIMFFTSVATIVTLVSELTPKKLSLSSAMLTMLGTVLGLVISFRTSSAYERYMEGRELWTSIAIASRNLAQFIWIHVPFERAKPLKTSSQDSTSNLTQKQTQNQTQNSTQDSANDLEYNLWEMLNEKRSMIKVVQAYSVSVKHLLHGEEIDAKLSNLIFFLPFYTDYLSNHPDRKDKLHEASAFKVQERPPALSPSQTGNVGSTPLGPEAPLSRCPIPFISTLARIWTQPRDTLPGPHSANNYTEMSAKSQAVNSEEKSKENVPHEIALFLSTYLGWLITTGDKDVPPSTATTAAWNAISSLQDSVANLDRIKQTPLPIAYQAHLRISLWIYLFFLPSQVWSSFRYLTIPGTAFASFLLLGFLEIGQEIEDPFNYDKNDLNLDAFCDSIEKELKEITERRCPILDKFPWPDQLTQAEAEEKHKEEMQKCQG